MTPTTNQYYSGLNRRFDRRAEQLLKLGFKYRCLEVARKCNYAFFIKNDGWKDRAIDASTVLNSTNVVYRAFLQRILLR